MPISAMTLEIGAAEQQRQDRADARRGQGREDRERVDVALVQHAEHDVDGDQRGQDQQRLVGQRGPEGLRRALEAGLDAGRQADARSAPPRSPCTASPERSAGRQVEGERDRRELSLVVDRERRGAVLEVREGAERHLRRRWPDARRCPCSVCGLRWNSRLHFEHHVVLVELREHRRDLPLAEGVVERVVDHLRRDAQARGGVAVDHQGWPRGRRSAGRWRRRAAPAASAACRASAASRCAARRRRASSRLY